MKLQHLFEALFNIDNAVDYIYEKAFEDFFEGIKKFKNGMPIKNAFVDLDFTDIAPNELRRFRNKEIEEALDLNPIDIECGVFTRGSAYYPTKNKIGISFNPQLYSQYLAAHTNNWTYSEMISSMNLTSIQKSNADMEYSGYKVKQSIAHELSHWIDDTLHERHLKKNDA